MLLQVESYVANTDSEWHAFCSPPVPRRGTSGDAHAGLSQGSTTGRLPPYVTHSNGELVNTDAKLLVTFGLAALHTDVMAGQPNDRPFLDTLAEATTLRRNMLVAAEPLADRGFVSADKLAEIKSGTGHVDTAHDVIALAELFGAVWSTIHDKTVITRTELDRAAKVGPELLALIGVRRQNGNDDTLRLRERAFTLLANAYDECRRALTFLYA